MLSKRVLLRLVNEGHVRGWDDPRMPTIAGLRRRGFPAEGIREFAAGSAWPRPTASIEVGQLEHARARRPEPDAPRGGSRSSTR